MRLAIFELAACTVVATKNAVTVCGPVPTAFGITVAEQLAAFDPLAARVHVPANASPLSDDVNVTVPVGLDGVPDEVSVTVTVTVLAWPTTTAVGDNVAAVVVARGVT